ncbi:MAG: metallophosphoesterase [Chloroflexi bacterium]|nr:metallophosphoesterase [Chloroflexota bacterium]
MITFLHISDTHISSDPPGHARWTAEGHGHPNRGVEALLDVIAALPFEIDFILHTGDVCNDPCADNYRCARDLLTKLPGPMYALPGNHDSIAFMLDVLHDGGALRLLRDDHVQLDGLHLITLDSTDADSHLPRLADSQIDYLEERLQAVGDQPAIVALHHMPVSSGVEYFDKKMRPQIGDRVHNVLKRHRGVIAGVFFGHVHLVASTQLDGIHYVCCPSTYYNNVAYPGMPERITDAEALGGFNLVMIGEGGTFLRRYSLPA